MQRVRRCPQSHPVAAGAVAAVLLVLHGAASRTLAMNSVSTKHGTADRQTNRQEQNSCSLRKQNERKLQTVRWTDRQREGQSEVIGMKLDSSHTEWGR